jgi:hypothetical protein
MIKVVDYPNVREKITSLGLSEPDGVVFLPRHFAEANSVADLEYENETSTFRSLMRQGGIPVSRLERGKINFKDEQSIAFIAPIIFITSQLIVQNPLLLDVMVNVVSSYVYDVISGTHRGDKVKMEYVVETKSGLYKRLTYEGNVDGMKELPKIIKETHDGQ